MSIVSIEKETQLRQTLISTEREGVNQVPKRSTSRWRSSFGESLAPAATPSEPKKEKIEFDQWTDLRPLNYIDTAAIKTSKSENGQLEGGKNLSFRKDTQLPAEENNKTQIMFSMKPQTWAVTRDQKYAYVYVPEANAIEVLRIPSFESLYPKIRYTLPDSDTKIKLLIIDQIEPALAKDASNQDGRTKEPFRSQNSYQNLSLLENGTTRISQTGISEAYDHEVMRGKPKSQIEDTKNQFERQKRENQYDRLYIVDLANKLFVMQVECPNLETTENAKKREWLQLILRIEQESSTSQKETDSNLIKEEYQYFSMHVNQATRELILIGLDAEKNKMKVFLSTNINGCMNTQKKQIMPGKISCEVGLPDDFKLKLDPLNTQFYDFDGNIYVKFDKVAIVINKESGKTWDPLNPKVNRKEGLKIQENKDYSRISEISEIIVQENLLIVQHTDNSVKMYAKLFGTVKYCLELVKQINLENSEDESGMKIFKFHAGQLFLQNNQEKRIIVISLYQGEEEVETKQQILWSYSGSKNSEDKTSDAFYAMSEIQLDYTHLIHLICEKNGRVMQLNAYKSEMIFESRWPMIRKKKKHQYFLISNGLLYQDGENDGRLVTIHQSGSIQQKDIDLEKYGSNSCKIFMKNFFYQEDLNQVMLISETNESSSPKTKFFMVSPDGHELREIKGLEQKNDVIFVGILPSSDPKLFLLFVIKSKKHVFCYGLEEKKDENGVRDFVSFHNEFVDIISSEDQFNKEDVYLIPKSDTDVASVIVKKNIRAKKTTSSQYIIYRVSIKDILEKIKMIAKSRDVNDKNAKVDNKVKMVKQTPGDIGVTFISLHGQKVFYINKDKRMKVLHCNKEKKDENQYEFSLSQENYKILEGFSKQQVKRRQQNDREQNELNEFILHNEKYLIFQLETTVFVFDCEVQLNLNQRELKLLCQINNVLPEASFKYDALKTVERYYIVMQSAFKGYLDIKEFMIFRENKSEDATQFSAKIPDDLKLDINQCVVYDLASSRCEVFDTIDKKQLKFWTNMAPRSILEKKRIIAIDKEAIGIFVEDSSMFDECLYFDTLHGNSIFHYIIEKQQIFVAIILKILKLNTDQIPILMFEDRNKKTCLDLLVEKKRQQKSLQYILKMIIYHEEAAPFYNKHIDKHLISLIGMNINLSDLFKSEILYHQLSTFDTLSTNKEIELWPNDSKTLREILEGRDEEARNKQLKILSGQENSKIQEVAGPKVKSKIQDLAGPEDGYLQETKVAVEYKIINLQQTLQTKPLNDKNSPTLIEQLLKYQGDTIYEFECIEKIIQYKWETFTRDFYTSQFRKFICIILCFAVSLFLSTLLLSDQTFKKDEPDMYELYKNIDMGLNIICGIFSLIIIYDEVQSMNDQGMQYLMDPQNYVDLPLFLLLLSQAVLKALLDDPSLTSHEAFKVIKIAMILLCFMKLNFYLQMYDSFSFLVNMLIQVFKDLSYFLAFFGMVVSTFSMLILVMMPTVKDNYEGTGLFAYLVMAFRSSLGDFSLEEYKAMSVTDAQGNQTLAVYPMQWLVWVVWLVIIVVGNVVFMNFIIAVVNQSYINSMSMQKAQSYRLKVPLINEQEKKIANIAKTKDFPNYIIVKTPANLVSEDPSQEQSRQFKDFQTSLKNVQSVQADQNRKLQQIIDAMSSGDAKSSQLLQPTTPADLGISSVVSPLPTSSQSQQRGFQSMQEESANSPFNGQNNLFNGMRGAVKRV